MLLSVLILMAPAALLAEPMLYMFPTNPQLHPSSMYPNQQFMRGKVRDLPDSGVIYLNRIKPIAQEFQQETTAEVEVSVQNIPRHGKSPSSFEKYNSVEERSPTRLPMITTSTTAPKILIEKKVNQQKQEFQKSKQSQLSVPEEAELDRLLDDLLKSDNIPKKTLQLAKIGRRSSKRHVGAYKPKVISFDGTARVNKQHARAHASPTSIGLNPIKTYAYGSSSSQNRGPDFDPWERMGQ